MIGQEDYRKHVTRSINVRHKFTIKIYVFYFTVENLNERLLLEWSFADGRFPDLI